MFSRKIAYVSALGVASVCGFIISEQNDFGQRLSLVRERLMKGIITENNEMLEFRTEKRGVKIFGLKQKVFEGGLTAARVAEAIIEAPVQDVAEIWWQHHKRQEWDNVNTASSELIREDNSDSRTVYVKSKPKPFISPRDFVFTICRMPTKGLNVREGSVLFVQVDAHDDVPQTKGVVRGDVNSMLLLQPLNQTTTKASYAIEVSPKGWIPSKAVEAAADDVPMTIAAIKDFCEKAPNEKK